MAIDLPIETASQIDVLQRQLDSMGLPVSWEPAGKIHLTLVFLGRLPDEEASRVNQVVRSVVGSYMPFSIQPAVLETMYHRHEPSVIYLLIANKDGELFALQRDLAKSLDQITPQPSRKYLPHVTIGKVRKSDPTYVKQVLDKLEQVEAPPLVEFEVTKIHLYESFLSKSGSSFTRLQSFSLGNNRSALADVS